MICKKVSEIPNILNLRSRSQENLRTVRQKISNEERDFPFSCIEKLGIRIFPEVGRGYARNFSGL